MTRKSWLPYAPYTYLTKNGGEETFDLFLLIPFEKGHSLEVGIPQYVGGTTRISVRVDETEKSGAGYYYKHFKLDPKQGNGKGRFRFFDEYMRIEVEVVGTKKNAEGERKKVNYETTLFYNDADDQLVSDEERGQSKVFNFPYIFLEQNIEEDNQECFRPYALIYLKDYEVKGQQVNITLPNNGICESLFFIIKDEHKEEGIMDPELMEINKLEKYYDDKALDGNFSTIAVIVEDEEDISRLLKNGSNKTSIQNLYLGTRRGADGDPSKGKKKRREAKIRSNPVPPKKHRGQLRSRGVSASHLDEESEQKFADRDIYVGNSRGTNDDPDKTSGNEQPNKANGRNSPSFPQKHRDKTKYDDVDHSSSNDDQDAISRDIYVGNSRGTNGGSDDKNKDQKSNKAKGRNSPAFPKKPNNSSS